MQVHHAMLDHPSWWTDEHGVSHRVVRRDDAVWHAVVAPTEDGVTTDLIPLRDAGEVPRFDRFDPTVLTGPDPLVEPLQQAGPVARLRNPDLWDAMATSIVRQVIRASQARKLYRTFTATHGEQITTPVGTAALFPSPITVLGLSDEDFAGLGMAFKRRPLRAAAETFLEFGAKWAGLEPERLVSELQTVPRIGPWTARATVADVTNDYRFYPYADLAVRTWAQRLAPELTWPETETEFAEVWQAMAGTQLSDWTLLTLAWGVRHAHGVAL